MLTERRGRAARGARHTVRATVLRPSKVVSREGEGGDFDVSPCGILPWIWARPGFLSGAGTGLSRSPAPRKRNATTQTTHTALRRGSCCTLCSRLRPQLRRWKAASEAPQRGRGRRMRFCYSQLELAALPEVEGDAQKNDILTGRVSPKLALDATKEGGS